MSRKIIHIDMDAFFASVEDQYADFTSNAEEVFEEGKSRLEQMSNDISR